MDGGGADPPDQHPSADDEHADREPDPPLRRRGESGPDPQRVEYHPAQGQGAAGRREEGDAEHDQRDRGHPQPQPAHPHRFPPESERAHGGQGHGVEPDPGQRAQCRHQTGFEHGDQLHQPGGTAEQPQGGQPVVAAPSRQAGSRPAERGQRDGQQDHRQQRQSLIERGQVVMPPPKRTSPAGHDEQQRGDYGEGDDGQGPRTPAGTVRAAQQDRDPQRPHAGDPRQISASRRQTSVIRPSTRCTVVPQCAATPESWVTTTRARPVCVVAASRAPSTSEAVRESNCPVGSSAKTTAGPVTRGAGDRDPLRLPAGQLAGSPLPRAGQTQPVQHRLGLSLGRAAPSPVQHQRQGDVLQRGQLGHQHPGLEDEPERLPPQPRPTPVVQGLDVNGGGCVRRAEDHLAGVDGDDPGQAVQQRGLARAGRPHHRDRLPRLDGEVDPRQRGQRPVPLDQAAPDQHRRRRLGRTQRWRHNRNVESGRNGRGTGHQLTLAADGRLFVSRRSEVAPSAATTPDRGRSCSGGPGRGSRHRLHAHLDRFDPSAPAIAGADRTMRCRCGRVTRPGQSRVSASRS